MLSKSIVLFVALLWFETVVVFNLAMTNGKMCHGPVVLMVDDVGYVCDNVGE